MKKLSIKQRLILSFSIVVVIVLLMVGFGIAQMNSLFNQTENLYEHPYKVSNAVLGIEKNSIESNGIIKKIAHDKSVNIPKLTTELEVIKGKIEADFSIIKDKFLGDDKMFTQPHEKLEK